MKNIIICADDYAQNTAVSEAIIELAAKQRLSATSCLTTSKYWQQHAPQLEEYKGKIDLGLHFNLTEGEPLTDVSCVTKQGKYQGLAALIVKSQLGLLNYDQLVEELTAQILAFRSALGCLPDYIDGHQHVHQLPIIRDALIEVYRQFYPANNAYVRLLRYHPQNFKQWVLKNLGMKQLEKLLQKNTVFFNRSFSGIYNLNPSVDYARLFKHFIKQSKSNGIIMCHPGKQSDDVYDTIAATRVNEFAYLSSEQFKTDCAALGVRPARFSFA
jgi:predicted glycoside hydrolase/deacetylase ChbG (UPF0249 family)